MVVVCFSDESESDGNASKSKVHQCGTSTGCAYTLN